MQHQERDSNLNPEDRGRKDECGRPGDHDRLLGLADGAQVLGLQRVHDGVVPEIVESFNRRN